MNKQEIDRLWLKYADGANENIPYPCMTYPDFAQAAAEIRRQALEGVAKRVVALRYDGNDLMDTEIGYNLGIREAVEAIRALAQPNGETE